MRLTIFTSVLVLLMSWGVARADTASTDGGAGDSRSACASVTEPDRNSSSPSPAGVGAGVVFDEHLLTDARRDEDYNGGGEITFSGRSGGPIGRALDRALGAVDEELCPAGRFKGPGWESAYAFAAGLLIFTPRDLSASQVTPGDRPYASLFFVSAGRRYVSSDADVAYNSSLTVGMLGLGAARSVQDALHHLSGSVQPEGWDHQISAGGEPTARYSGARQELFGDYGDGPWHADAKWTLAGSAGTVTEASLALGARWGRIESPWWGFTPEENMYVQETQPLLPPLAVGAPIEVFAFAGARAKVRAYNAFLEGQFRHSDLAYHWGDVNQLLGEAWAGVEMRTPSGWAVQYLARLESPELRSGVGSRTIFWGSLEVSRTLQ
jgi:hypothetical protein